MKKVIIAGFCFIFFVFRAEATEVPPFIAEISDISGKVFLLTFTPPPLHHFNAQAPHHLFRNTSPERYEDIKGFEVKENQASVKISKDIRDIKVQLFLCDDAKKYCISQIRFFSIQTEFSEGVNKKWKLLSVSKDMRNEMKTKISQSKKETQASSEAKKLGFIFNNPEKALQLALKQKRPLLIDFFGIWCPPCNTLDEMVFSSKKFQDKTKRFVKLKLDADDPISWKMKENYHVGGYPTVIFANRDGDEITRVVGARELQDFIKIVGQAIQNEKEPLSVLKRLAAQKNLSAMLRLGDLYFDRTQYEDSDSFFQQANDLSPKSLTKDHHMHWSQAQVEILKEVAHKNINSENQSKYKNKLQEVLQQFPKVPFTLDVASDLMALADDLKDEGLKKQAAQTLVDTTDFMIKNPHTLEGQEVSLADIYQYLGEGEQALENKVKAKMAFSNAVKEYDRKLLAKKLDPGRERGLNLEKAYCLSEADRLDEALQLYKKLERVYPEEFTFYFAHASLLKRRKDFQSAESIARQALDFSYGDNRLRSAELLAVILKETGKKDEAEKMLRNIISESKLPQDSYNRTHRYYNKLKSLLTELDKT